MKIIHLYITKIKFIKLCNGDASMKTNKKLLIPILLAIFTISVSFSINTASAVAQPTIYVDPNGNDAWSGESAVWDGTDGPKKTIKNAIGTVDYRWNSKN